MYKWGLAPTSTCACGVLDQTTAHAILECSLYHQAHRGYHGLLIRDDKTRCWLNNIAHQHLKRTSHEKENTEAIQRTELSI